MMIRHATEEDLPDIVSMSERFYAQTSYPRWAPFDAMSVEALAKLLLQIGIVLLAEDDGIVVGMLAVIVAPTEFNNNVTAAGEIVWWVNEEARSTGAGVKLLRSIKPLCEVRGVRAIKMMVLADSPPQAVALYEAMGYVHTESTYTLALGER